MRPVSALLLAAAWLALLPAAPLAAGPERATRLQGAASLGRNRPVVGATVLVRATDESSRFHVTATDVRGRFRVDGLPDGTYRVEIRREGLGTVIKEGVVLRFPSRAVIEVTMSPTDSPPPATPVAAVSIDDARRLAVRGRVVERDGGAVLPEVALRFARPDGLADPVVARTGADGGFSVEELPEGGWRLESRVVGFLPLWASLSFEESTELVISLVAQPAGYEPSPLELMPPEQPIPPVRPRSVRPAPPIERTEEAAVGPSEEAGDARADATDR
jgi:hypothetical protein